MQHLIVGMGEIGSAWFHVLSESDDSVYGLDIDKTKCVGNPPNKIDIMHICIPFTNYNIFEYIIYDYYEAFEAKETVIHSSVSPGTTQKLSESIPQPLIYSPMRGVHSRMTSDMKRYTKYYSTTKNAKTTLYLSALDRVGVKAKRWQGSTTSLELAKLLMDVVYYGWQIIFAQHVKVLADRHNVDDKQLWEFTDEIHKFLGNRPRMFSGEGIGGHCVMQDKDLLDDSFLDVVFSHDQTYRRHLKDGRS